MNSDSAEYGESSVWKRKWRTLVTGKEKPLLFQMTTIWAQTIGLGKANQRVFSEYICTLYSVPMVNNLLYCAIYALSNKV
jgi:hypothetical protein